MKISLVNELQNDISLLRSKTIHVVGFAEVGLSFFRSYLQHAFDYSLEDAVSLCEKINAADETGTIYPKGFLTGIPVRFFRQHIHRSDLDRFRICLRDAFIANRDYCKSKEMAFHFACDIKNRDLILDETISMAKELKDDNELESVVIVVDELTANTFTQKAILGS